MDSLKYAALSLLAEAETHSFLNSKFLHLGVLKCPKSKLFENPFPKSTLKRGFGFWVRNGGGQGDTAAMIESPGFFEEEKRETHQLFSLLLHFLALYYTHRYISHAKTLLSVSHTWVFQSF